MKQVIKSDSRSTTETFTRQGVRGDSPAQVYVMHVAGTIGVATLYESETTPSKPRYSPRDEVANYSFENCFAFRNLEMVIRYIEDCHFPDLKTVLLDGIGSIRRHFERERLILEVVSDPEIPNYERLLLKIQTQLEPDDALERLERLEDEWFLHAGERTNWAFNLYLEYK